MDLLKKNLTILEKIKNLKIITYLKFAKEKLYIDGIEIDLNKVDLEEIFRNNNLDNLRIADIKKITVLVLNKIKLKEIKANLIEEESLKITNFKILNKVREDGTYLEYPYYIDDNNKIHVLYNYARTDILYEYQKLFLLTSGQISGQILYDYFERKMKKIELTPDYKNLNMSEENKFESELINKQNQSQRVYLNQEHDLYSLGTNLYVHNFQNGNLTQNTFCNETILGKTTYYDQFEKQSIEILPEQQNVAHLISIYKYFKLIKKFNNIQRPEIGLFESFMENLMIYQNHVSDDIKNVLEQYQYYMEIIAFKKFTTTFEREALKRYRYIKEKVQANNYTSIKKDNIKIHTRKLETEYKNHFMANF